MLDGLNLALPAGKVTCVLADSRAVSTLIVNALGGLAPCTAGSIRIAGRELHRWSPRLMRREGVGIAPADLQLLPELPVWRSLIIGAEPPAARLLGEAQVLRLVGPEAAALGLGSELLRRPPDELTPTAQRLLLATRAFAHGRRVVLLDEPTTGMPLEPAALVLRRITEARDAGAAVLLATPNVQHAWAVGDQFVLVYAGRTLGTFARGQTSREELHRAMLGNQDFQELAAELSRLGAAPPEPPPPTIIPRQAPKAAAPRRAPRPAPAAPGPAPTAGPPPTPKGGAPIEPAAPPPGPRSRP
jgi:simple sugar transport system ATP-binding protein